MPEGFLPTGDASRTMIARNTDAGQLKAGVPADEVAATTALIRARVVPTTQLAALIDQFGSAVKLVQLSEADRLFAVQDASHTLVGAVTPEILGRAVVDVEEWLSRGLDVRTLLDPNYPRSLHDIFDRPPLLFIQGRWVEELDSRSVAVVGTRTASLEGRKRARRLSRELVEAGFTVLSGLALGIDTAAHQAALKAHGRTVAVMGTGIDHRYPASNAPLAERVVDSGGALISQFFPEQTPRPWTFPMRNVVMSGLALATVVIEAGSTSGARMQARVALQHGRTVFLLRSLVNSHDWAKKYATEGAYETKAIMVGSTREIVERLDNAMTTTTLRL